MKKRKIIYSSAIALLAALMVGDIVLFALKLIPTYVGLLLLGMLALGLVAMVIILIKLIRQAKKPVPVSVEGAAPLTGNSMIDIYGALGLKPQYNKDGSIKDIYELLGILPEYDEKGNRIPTVYEQLGTTPRFDKDGKELPRVFVIKNRVKRVAKVDVNCRTLVRKVNDKDKEDLLIRETLKKKLDEAEQTGDKQQVEAIKKVIEEKKPAPKKAAPSAPSKAPTYLSPKGAKPTKRDPLPSRLLPSLAETMVAAGALTLFANAAARAAKRHPAVPAADHAHTPAAGGPLPGGPLPGGPAMGGGFRPHPRTSTPGRGHVRPSLRGGEIFGLSPVTIQPPEAPLGGEIAGRGHVNAMSAGGRARIPMPQPTELELGDEPRLGRF